MTSALMEALLKDLRFAARQLRNNPVFAVTAIFVLALGMCASLAIFAFADAVLIKPLPYRNPGRLVAVYEVNIAFPKSNLSYADYLDWKGRNRVFDSLDVYQPTGFLLATPSGAQPARGARVSSGFFKTLGVAPALGRDFIPGEDLPSAPHAALLSYAVWQQRYSGKRGVLGQVVTLDGAPHVIIGVLPRDFYFAPAGRVEFWTALQPFYPCDLRRSCHGIWGVARLRDGISLQAAIANVKSIAKDLEKQYPDSNRDQGADLGVWRRRWWEMFARF
jgi:macrolide transport system ATP-binding/permease protein